MVIIFEQNKVIVKVKLQQ